MMKLKDFNIYLFLFLCTQWVFAVNVTFEVYDVKTNEPISKVQIITGKGNLLGLTNTKGVLMAVIPNSKLHIVLVNDGYHILEKDISALEGQVFKLYLNPLLEELSTVLIRSKKKQDYAVTTLKPVQGTHIYAGKKNEVVNLDLIDGNKASNNARQIYANVVGLNIYDNNDGGLQLNIGGRGLDPNRTANFNTRQNDYDISADVLGYPESYYTPPTEALSQIQVIRGAASLQYGTQFGGLVNFITHKPSNKPIEVVTRNTVGSFNTFSNFTSLSGTTNKLGYYVYYNGKKGDGFRPNSDYKSNNLFAHLDYQLNDKTSAEFEFSYLNYLAHQPGGLSDVEFLDNPEQSYLTRNWFDVNWKLFSFKLKHDFTEKQKISLNLFALDASRKAVGFRGSLGLDPKFFSSNGNSPDQIDESGAFVNQRDLLVGKFQNWGAEIRYLSNYKLAARNAYFLIGAKTYKASNSERQGAGSSGTDADFSFIDSANYPGQNDFDFPNFNTSVFGENIFYINQNLSITPGFRFEHIKTESEGSFYDAIEEVTKLDANSFVRNFVLLGLGVSYKPKSYFELYGNFSQNYRSVTFSNIRTVNPSFVIDENITDEEGFTADLGVRGRFKKDFSYDVNVFSLLYDNRIGQVFSNEPGTRGKWVRKNIGTAFIYGLESLLQWNIKQTFFKDNQHLKFDVFTNTSITKSSYVKSEETGVEGNEVEFIPALNLKTGVHFGWKNLLAGLQYTYLSEQFTDVTNSPYNPNNSTDLNGAIPEYDIVDFSLSYEFNKHFKLESGINNVLDNSYFTRRATGYPGPGIIPASPRSFYGTLQIKF